MFGPFNTDTAALKTRQDINTQLAKHNLEEWILNQITLFDGMDILDLGCGTGKQLFAIAPKVNGKLVGIDISQAAIDEVNGKHPQVSAIRTSFDDPIEGKYDLILSTYAIYYAKDMLSTIVKLKNNLKPNGKMFLVGPGDDTNHEFTYRMSQKPIKDFLDTVDLPFAHVETVRLENKVVFPDKMKLFDWYSNHNSYDKNSVWKLSLFDFPLTITKNVLGVHLYD